MPVDIRAPHGHTVPRAPHSRQGRLVVTGRYLGEVLGIGAVVAITVGLTHGPRDALLGGGMAVVTLLITVLMHEGGHAAAAALCGVPVHALTLRGALTASVRRDRARPGPKAARTEGMICLAGPAVSLALLGIAAAALLVGVDGAGRGAAWCLLAANLIAVTGSLPGVPSTDGTRALRAWRNRIAP